MEVRTYKVQIPSSLGLGTIPAEVVLKSDYDTLLEKAGKPGVFVNESFEIDFQLRTVSIKNFGRTAVVAGLTVVEFKIMSILIQAQKTMSRNELIDLIWGSTSICNRNLDTHICHLRKKIKVTGFTIKNIRSDGYYITKVG